MTKVPSGAGFSLRRASARLACFLFALLASAQELKLYSELQRIDPFGNVVAADRIQRPREIISPAVVRNAFASFHVVVAMPPGVAYDLHVAQNPEGAVFPKLYRERHRQYGKEWIPDTLVPVALPLTGALNLDVPGSKVDVFWLDLWVPATAPVERVRVEVQLHAKDRWIIYPLEVRITRPVVPRQSAAAAVPLPGVEAPADDAAISALKTYLCGQKPAPQGAAARSIRQLLLRNAWQDIALARKAEGAITPAAAHSAMLKSIAAADAKTWCANPPGFRAQGPETWLKLRNAIWTLENTGP